LAVFDPGRNETLVFGGGDSTSAPQATWAYEANGTWQQILPSAAGPGGGFYETGADFDLALNATVEFGSEGLGSFYGIPTIQNLTNSTWALLTNLADGSLNGNQSAFVGTNQSFSTEPYGGLPPYRFNWTFAPNVTSNASRPTYVFNHSGTYSVQVVVTDAAGQTTSASLTVDVTEKSTPSAGFTQWYEVLGGVGAVLVAALIAVLVLRRKRKTKPEPLSGAPSGPPSADPGSAGESSTR
jgi:PKD domain